MLTSPDRAQKAGAVRAVEEPQVSSFHRVRS